MNKRGISAVVATVLIILITISSISIVWLMIIPIIKENLEFSSLERGVVIVTSGGYTVYDPERKIAAVKVKMEEDTVEIPFVEVIFMVDGNSIKFVRDFNLEINEDKLFYFILNKKPESVSVAPIFRIGNKEKVGSIYNSVQLKSGDLTPSDIELYDGLVSYWRFEGDALDTAGNNNGILNGDDGELIINRGAETGTNEGWWGFDGATNANKYSGIYSFYQEGPKFLLSSEFIPLDLNKEYHLEGWFKSYGVGNSRIYYGFEAYDINKVWIESVDVNVVPNSETTFSEDCSSADTSFRILDGSNWVTTYHARIIFDIDDSGNFADLPNRNQSNRLGISTIPSIITDSGLGYWEITLGGGQTIGKDCVSGETIRQHISGSARIYTAASSKFVPPAWTSYSGNVNGIALTGIPANNWWAGTKYFKIMVLVNYKQTADYKIYVDDISLKTTPPTYTGPKWIGGISGQSVSFDGDNDYIDFGNNIGIVDTGTTVSFWMNAKSSENKDGIVSKSVGGAMNDFVYVVGFAQAGSAKKIGLHTSNFTNQYNDNCLSTNDIAYNEWIHVVMTWNKSYCELYINGVLDISEFTEIGMNTTVSYPTQIGIGFGNNGNLFEGDVDEVMIFNRIISGGEVGEIYNSQFI